jgi:hypothetical protein
MFNLPTKQCVKFHAEMALIGKCIKSLFITLSTILGLHQARLLSHMLDKVQSMTCNKEQLTTLCTCITAWPVLYVKAQAGTV